MHNHNDKSMKWMMWMMAICCGLPILFILLFGVGSVALGASKWVVLGVMALMLLAHLFMMRKHKHDDNNGDSNHSCH
jgi:cell division protein FtsW (lipid II flippase)